MTFVNSPGQKSVELLLPGRPRFLMPCPKPKIPCLCPPCLRISAKSVASVSLRSDARSDAVEWERSLRGHGPFGQANSRLTPSAPFWRRNHDQPVEKRSNCELLADAVRSAVRRPTNSRPRGRNRSAWTAAPSSRTFDDYLLAEGTPRALRTGTVPVTCPASRMLGRNASIRAST